MADGPTPEWRGHPRVSAAVSRAAALRRRVTDLRAVDGEGARGARPPLRAADDGGDRGGDVHLGQHRAHPRPQHPAQAGRVPAERGGAARPRPEAHPQLSSPARDEVDAAPAADPWGVDPTEEGALMTETAASRTTGLSASGH